MGKKNIENIIYRYAPFFISNLLNASDGDEFRRKMPTSLISRGGEDKEEEEGARAHARAIGEPFRRRREEEEEEGGGRGEGDAFASVAAREEVPGIFGGRC